MFANALGQERDAPLLQRRSELVEIRSVAPEARRISREALNFAHEVLDFGRDLPTGAAGGSDADARGENLENLRAMLAESDDDEELPS